MNKAPGKYLFIINPIAGDIDKAHIPDHLKDICRQKEVDFSILETTGNDDQIKIKDRIDEFDPEVIVVIGGDGTVNMVSRVIMEKDIIMGIVPQGSGNGLAKDLKIPLDYNKAVDLIFKMNVIAMDTLLINDHPSFHISDIGFNARVVENFTKKKIRGQFAYAIALLQEFFSYKPKRYKVVTPEMTWEDTALLVAIANANQFGSNTTINPIGEVDDGNFEISILKYFSLIDGFAVFYRLWRNRIHSSRYSKLIKCTEAVIYNLDEETMQIDGEMVPSYKEVKIKLLPRSLKVIVPEKKTS